MKTPIDLTVAIYCIFISFGLFTAGCTSQSGNTSGPRFDARVPMTGELIYEMR